MKVHELIRKLEKVNRNKQVRIEIPQGEDGDDLVEDYEIKNTDNCMEDYILLTIQKRIKRNDNF